ncbi:hypothetical protein NEOKW01_0573 [Nematocida sp. AWRm80]|nr:hypothetical protein NEOKW01_0573 [Nematocida sp. AWRm80]
MKNILEKINKPRINNKEIFGLLNINNIQMPLLEEGLLSDELFNTIENRRILLLEKISKIANVIETNPDTTNKFSETQTQIPPEDISEIKSTLQLVILEIERLQIQIGSKCISECNTMINQLDTIKTKVEDKNILYNIYYTITIILIFILFIYLISTI